MNCYFCPNSEYLTNGTYCATCGSICYSRRINGQDQTAYITFYSKNYLCVFNLLEAKCEVYRRMAVSIEEPVLILQHIPDWTPQNLEKKVKKYSVFS
jgi:uncharacterized cysteine cluster protein YcgN (CxxCxxCC family)